MLVVHVPVAWICLDVCVDLVIFRLVPDDGFVIISLPDRDAFRAPDLVDPFSTIHFEISNDHCAASPSKASGRGNVIRRRSRRGDS